MPTPQDQTPRLWTPCKQCEGLGLLAHYVTQAPKVGYLIQCHRCLNAEGSILVLPEGPTNEAENDNAHPTPPPDTIDDKQNEHARAALENYDPTPQANTDAATGETDRTEPQ